MAARFKKFRRLKELLEEADELGFASWRGPRGDGIFDILDFSKCEPVIDKAIGEVSALDCFWPATFLIPAHINGAVSGDFFPVNEKTPTLPMEELT
jgi:hypothetical protein